MKSSLSSVYDFYSLLGRIFQNSFRISIFIISDPFCLLYTCSYYCYLGAYSVFKANLVWDYHILLLLAFCVCVCECLFIHVFDNKSCLSGTKHSSRFMSDMELRSYGCKYASCSVSQLCPNLCNPMVNILPGSSVHGIFQARIVVRVVISHDRGFSQSGD